jgi:hypothetical protein
MEEFLCTVRARNGINSAGEHQGRNMDDEALGVSKFVGTLDTGACTSGSGETLAPGENRPGA